MTDYGIADRALHSRQQIAKTTIYYVVCGIPSTTRIMQSSGKQVDPSDIDMGKLKQTIVAFTAQADNTARSV